MVSKLNLNKSVIKKQTPMEGKETKFLEIRNTNCQNEKLHGPSNETGMAEDPVTNKEKKWRKSPQYSSKRQKIDNMKIKKQRKASKVFKHQRQCR